MADEQADIVVRDAVEADVPALMSIKGAHTEALHRDRIRDALEPGFRYLVLLAEHEVIGFVCLVERRPARWSDAGDTRHLPQIVDLEVHQAWRGRGYGTAFIGAIERIAAADGHNELFLSVEPEHNPRAHALYQRLGYRRLHSEPYRDVWEFQDTAGKTHSGVLWLVDMVKTISTGSAGASTRRGQAFDESLTFN